MQREEPYLALTCISKPVKAGECSNTQFAQVLHGCRQLVSLDVGLSPATSATPVNCCHGSVSFRHSVQTALFNGEEGGDDVKSAWPLRPGLHTYYNARYRRIRYREVEEITKTGPSSDWRLQLASMKPESLVMAHQLRRREYVPGSCTHRPSHHGSRL